MKPFLRHSEKGSLVLVALCLVAVLGIALASYLGVSLQAMKLSNRAAQTGLSAHLAETGLEEAMRAFNTNNWATYSSGGTTATWSISGSTASCTITLPATKFAKGSSSGVTGSIKVRVDNYNTYNQSSTWSSTANYRVGDLVGYSGIWYRCVQNHINKTPGNLAYWVQAPIPWAWNSNFAYVLYDVVNYGGVWYRCNTAHTSGASFVAANWGTMPSGNVWATGTVYAVNDVVINNGTWYICTVAHTSPASFTTANWLAATPVALAWASGSVYARGSYAFNGGAWYYCTNSHVALFSSDLTDTAKWVPLNSPSTTWASSTKYAVGDYVYYSGTWYRCTTANTNLSFNSGNWASGSTVRPYISWSWRNGNSYEANDVVYYSSSGSGSWYRCILAHTVSGSSPTPTNTTYWEPALDVYTTWSSSDTYYPGDVVYRSGAWYRCILSHTNHVPANATYWATTPWLTPAWDSIRQYAVNDFVTYNGIWYRCLTANSNSNPPFNVANWASTENATYKWSSATTYSSGTYVSYGKVWYKCILNPTANQTPNNSTYWTAQAAPVIYAEGTATLPDGTPAIKTQLRATVATAPLLPNAIAATTTLAINGAGTVDSYDASSGTYNQTSTPFTALLPNQGYSAILAGGNATATAVTVTSTTVKGYVAAPSSSSSPYAPLWSYGVSASVTGTSAAGIDLTRVSRSPYIPQFDIRSVVNSTDLALVNNSTNTIGTPGAVAPTVYNLTSSSNRINLNTSTDLLIINGPVILNATSDFNISLGKMVITPNGSAEIHFAGNMAISGSNGIDNQTLDPKKLIIINNGSGGSYSFTTSTPLYGCLYLPNATGVTFGASTVFYGAISAKSITFSGAANLHYDTSLRYATSGGVDAPFAISEWRELTDPVERAVLP